MTSPDAVPGQGDALEPPGPSPSPAAAGGSVAGAVPVTESLLPGQSREDTDAAWGEYPAPPDDRLYRDRPPHWDDF